jgi:hypothetical protein
LIADELLDLKILKAPIHPTRQTSVRAILGPREISKET